ncbi:MerR family transcriptional regulator [Gordonia amarae]|uniref:MerR family transcriptional regulator n=2 Tax=Gordonia amarae TaxID=36821 RepID=A0A857LNU8_9ACTN|nr:MerR family transcriptional regulator [Gordonia amarae]MCS3877055.1 DNA-binding transcriptional MerR regulator [Gordonia amarae]QHN15867.1 MerR family transcriptional regulator [Gordonia amarae]QHN20435.1 MerR family transcriptional regulator [Gordonia amarae]QHN29287.1 MerR family transcriptional regulator [Gordonia amarae]QHN38065.1 MerR family transcriptional regulator [Gordonia amarae]
MTDLEPSLMTIGEFARATGLTASALRFYADSGLLPPADVDGVSGYRRYAPGQVGQARLLRRLREIGTPLSAVAQILDAEPAEAARLVDDHLRQLSDDTTLARDRGAAIIADLAGAHRDVPVRVRGPVFAAAVDQVLTATVDDRNHAILNTVRIESDCATGTLTLVATDRVRLAIRTLAVAATGDTGWAATVSVDDLRAGLATIRRCPTLELDHSAAGLTLTGGDSRLHCRTTTEPYPDYRLMLSGLSDPATSVIISGTGLRRLLETLDSEHITITIGESALSVAPAGGDASPTILPATVAGPPMAIAFAVTTLYPAVTTTLGDDLLLDLRTPDRPVTVRSANDGGLITLVMPVSLTDPGGTRER